MVYEVPASTLERKEDTEAQLWSRSQTRGVSPSVCVLLALRAAVRVLHAFTWEAATAQSPHEPRAGAILGYSPGYCFTWGGTQCSLDTVTHHGKV